MTALNFNSFSEVAYKQNEYVESLNNLKNEVSKNYFHLKEKYPKLTGLSYLYLCYGHFGNPSVSGMNKEGVDKEFDVWVELKKKDAVDYLKEMSVDNTFEILKKENKIVYDAFFSGKKYLLAIRPYDKESNLSSVFEKNTGAYLIRLE